MQQLSTRDAFKTLQDILVAAALAECSYKPVDHLPEEALALTAEILQNLVPPQLISLQAVQFCQPHVRHRYMLAECEDALYVGIIGTKLRWANKGEWMHVRCIGSH